MKKRYILLAKRYSDNKFFTKISHSEYDMIYRTEMICHRDLGEVITHLIEKESGHRYFLDIKDCNNPNPSENINLCTKKSAIFATKALKEYDDTLKINIIKLY